MGNRTVTITSTKLVIATNGLQLRFYGLDIISATPIQRQLPNVNTGAGDWFVDLMLTGGARDAYGAKYELRIADVSNQPNWRNTADGAEQAASDIAVMIRSVPSGGGGGGQVDTIVPGAAIDVDSTDPVNPIVNVKVDGVTIGINGLNELEVPAGGGGYVPTTRTINTTAPLTGGGNLSANRTIAIPQANGSTDGFLDSGDWTTFNNKVTSVGATFPITTTGGATPTIGATTSNGGNGAADSGKFLVFGSSGQILAAHTTGNAVTGTTSGAGGTGVRGLQTGSSGYGVRGTASTGVGVYGTSTSGIGVGGQSFGDGYGVEALNSSLTVPALHVDAVGGGPIAHFESASAAGTELTITDKGGLLWNSAGGDQETATNLPTFGALTKGVVPAAGAVPAATNFLTETGVFAVPAGTGVPTSRTISTTSPLAGGGDLSADRTLTIADAAADGATKGAAAFTAADFNSAAGVISIDYANGQKATSLLDGFLSAADWATFNAKQAALVSATNIKTINGSSILGAGDLAVVTPPAGSTTQVQYNNAGAFGGASRILVTDNDLEMVQNAAPTAPAVGNLKTGSVVIAGPTASGLAVPYQMASFGQIWPILPRGRYYGECTPVAGVAAPSVFGLVANGTGTNTLASCANTNRYSRMPKTEWLVATPASNAVAGVRYASNTGTTTLYTGSAGDGGYFVRIIAGPATGVTTATSRFFMGTSGSTAAPTDVEPSTINNTIGAGYDAADANIQIMTKGAGAVVKTDTGIAVPGADRAAMYQIDIYCPNSATQAAYITFTDLINGTVFRHAETTAGNLPLTNVAVSGRVWSSAGGTSSAIGIALHYYYQTTEW